MQIGNKKKTSHHQLLNMTQDICNEIHNELD